MQKRKCITNGFFFINLLECAAVSSSDLMEMPEYLSCYIPKTCTAVDCCMDFSLLNLTLNFYVSVDTCGYIIRGGLEKFTFELPYSKYVWGKYIVTPTVLIVLCN